MSSFWNDLVIPFQEEDGDFQFANPVVVAQHFIKAVGMAAYIGQQGEDLTADIAQLKLNLTDLEDELRVFRQYIFTTYFKDIPKSGGNEVKDAFVRLKAIDDGSDTVLAILEKGITTIKRTITEKSHKESKFKAQLKLLETTMSWSKQYLDFDKMIMRSEKFG